MSAEEDGIVHYDVTTPTLVEALRNIPLTGEMTREALLKMAGAILGQMPEASPEPAGADLYRAVNDAIAAAVAAERENVGRILIAKIQRAYGVPDTPDGEDATEAIVQVVRDVLADLASPGEHYVTFDAGGYYVAEHPAACLSSPASPCQYAAAVAAIVLEVAPPMFGTRWRIAAINGDGRPYLVHAEPEQP